MNETKCLECSYICGVLAKMCDDCFAKWEATAEEAIKHRHTLPVTPEEIKRLQGIELAAARVYRSRHDILNEPDKAYSLVIGIGRAMSTEKAPDLPAMQCTEAL